MPRKAVTDPVVDNPAADDQPAAVIDTADKVNDENKKKQAELKDSDEIQVVSLVQNVSYYDNKTGDMYEWDKIGHVEIMTVEVLKNLWRNHKAYFRNLLLKPLDDRIIKLFGLSSVYDKYAELMDATTYTRDRIAGVCKEIEGMSNGLRSAVYNKIISMVTNGEISDVVVIRALERQFDLDLIALL